jgi:multiple sugar transport system substrate-binding protein
MRKVASVLALLLATAADAETTIVYQAWGSPREGEVWNQIARAFEAKHPDIKVDVQLSDWDSYWEKLRVLMAGGTPPDVFAMSPPLYPDWQSRGVLLNIQPYLDADPAALDGIYPVTLEAYKTTEGYFGLPRDFQTIVLYYNKGMFDAAGLAYPTADWTWDDLRVAAKTLTLDKDADGRVDQWGFTADNYGPEAFIAPVIRSYGGQLVDIAAGKTLLDTVEAVAGLQFVYDIFTVDKSMPNAQQVEAYGWDPFLAGVTAMTLSGHWSVPDYSVAPFQWDIVPIPQGPKGRVTTTNSAGFVIANETKSPDAAVEFVKFAIGEEGQTFAASIGLAVPIRETVALSAAYLDQTSAKIDHKLFIDALAYAQPLPVFKGYEEWSTALGDTLNLVFTEQMSLEDGIAEVVAAGNDAIAKAN